jgi:hypothetical protein
MTASAQKAMLSRPIRTATLQCRLTRTNGNGSLEVDLVQRSTFESPGSPTAFGSNNERSNSCRTLLELQIVHFKSLTLFTQQSSSGQR